MAKLKEQDLVEIKGKVEKENTLTEDGYSVNIIAHLGTCGIAAGGDAVLEALEQEIDKSGRKDIRIVISGCMGMCSSEPNVTVKRINEDAVLYQDLDDKKMRQIFQGHIMEGEIQDKYALAKIK